MFHEESPRPLLFNHWQPFHHRFGYFNHRSESQIPGLLCPRVTFLYDVITFLYDIITLLYRCITQHFPINPSPSAQHLSLLPYSFLPFCLCKYCFLCRGVGVGGSLPFFHPTHPYLPTTSLPTFLHPTHPYLPAHIQFKCQRPDLLRKHGHQIWIFLCPGPWVMDNTQELHKTFNYAILQGVWGKGNG